MCSSHSRRYDVLGIGVVAVDDLLYVDRYPPAEHKTRVLRCRRECGGLTGTALVAAARLGARAGYVGTLGTDDELSQIVRRQFNSEGIDLAVCVMRPDARPYHSTIIVGRNPSTRTIFSHVEGHAGADPDRPSADVICSTAVLLVDHHAMPGTRRAVEVARAAGVAVVADFERHGGEGFDELVPRVDHLVLPERFAKELTGADSPQEAVKRLCTPDRQAVVVTCGPRGCYYADANTSDKPRHLPAPPLDAVDTTGCGDVFHGAYCTVLAEGQPLPARVRFATATAALKATQEGGQSGIPSREAVDRFLAR
jgi:sugar/nucleoside kinase (ribokinase family)